MSSALRMLLKDSSILVLSRFMMMLVNIALVYFVSPNDYGVYSYYDYIANFCISLSNFGLGAVLVKEIRNEDISKIVTNFFVIKVVSIFLLCFFSHSYLMAKDGYSSIVILNVIYVLCSSFLWEWFFVSTNNLKIMVVFYLVHLSILSCGLAIFNFFGELTVSIVRLIQIIAVIVSVIPAIRVILKNMKWSCFDVEYIRRIAKQGVFLLCSQTLQNGALIITSSVIKTKFGYEVLGVFSLALRLCNMFVTLRNILVTPLTKFMISCGVEKYNKIFKWLLLAAISFVAILQLGLYFFVNLIKQLSSYGDELFLYFMTSLHVLTLIPVFMVLFLLDGVVLNIKNKQHRYFATIACSFSLFYGLINSFGNTLYEVSVIYLIFEVGYISLNHLMVRIELRNV